MKNAILFLSLSLLTVGIQAQTKFFTREGHIRFFSSTPIEDIEADNKKATIVLDEATGRVEVSALIKSFEFEKALMQEHFNENYMESDKFDKATFKGTIEGFKVGSYSAETKVMVKGSLTIHGVTKEVTIPATIQRTADGYVVKCNFKVVPEEYDIEIPNTVREKIAKEIEVSLNATLAPLNK